MYGNKVKQYQREALKSRLASADPYEIIKLLMDGAIESMKIARIMIEQREFEGKSKAISKASSIIDSLRVSLDHSVGGDMTENLAALYFYMVRRLTDASVQNDVSIIDEVVDLLSTIKSAWDSIPETARMEAYATRENELGMVSG
ncbi:flagellar export chaperone FliS [Rheinheimera marina]|uniref:Flagellar secretion chaperone FliS n=1 Tax=Rheinheimera marina TaxID=1774958 RepID=A0ABV9JRX1_9GAMM